MFMGLVIVYAIYSAIKCWKHVSWWLCRFSPPQARSRLKTTGLSGTGITFSFPTPLDAHFFPMKHLNGPSFWPLLVSMIIHFIAPWPVYNSEEIELLYKESRGSQLYNIAPNPKPHTAWAFFKCQRSDFVCHFFSRQQRNSLLTHQQYLWPALS